MILSAVNPAGHTIHFDSDLHKYYTDSGIILTSVTQFVSSFFPKFNTYLISQKYAEKHGLQADDVRSQWKQKQIVASRLGTEIHNYAQSLFIQKPLVFNTVDLSGRRADLCQAVDQAYLSLTKRFVYIAAEKIIFSINLGLAGTTDLLLSDPKKNAVLILDWKTNSNITQENMWQNALTPICHLEDCDYNKYLLQLNIYRKILLHEKYFPEVDEIRMALAHLQNRRVTWIPLPVIESDVDAMCRWM